MCDVILIMKILFSQIDYQMFLSEQNIDDFFLIDKISSHIIAKKICNEKKITLNEAELSLEYFKDNYSSKQDLTLVNNHNENVLFFLANVSSKLLIFNGNEFPVCQFSCLLNWHTLSSYIGEDFLITAFLAQNDIAKKISRTKFEWPFSINHDDKNINKVLEREMSELHSHLYGASINFELNWLSLMNRISNRKCFFDELNVSLSSRHSSYNTVYSNLYSDIIKAAAIRFILFSNNLNNDDSALLKYSKILYEKNSVLLIAYANQLDNDLQVCKQMYGRRFNILANKIVDYALFDEYDCKINEEDIALVGERKLLYYTFYKTFNNKIANTIYPSLLYKYILIKNRLREELTQINKIVGFDNFNYFERRKEFFIDDDPIYHRLLIRIAINYFLDNSGNKRYLETRITPKDTPQKIIDSIKKLDYIVSYNKDNYIKGMESETGKSESYHYILHFIKTKESNVNVYSCIHPRNSDLRIRVKNQAEALAEVLKTNSKINSRIISIDAANSEINARPEVFAQAFRYIRAIHCKTSRMCFTYHVGEDFLDIIDGLRAVDEVLTFMNFTERDRLGHALVLGIDVKRYYAIRNNKVTLSKQMLLDNYIWLFYKAIEYHIWWSIIVLYKRRKIINPILTELYGKDISYKDYYDSWLLRGNNPNHNLNQYDLGWYNYNINENSKMKAANNNQKAKDIFFNYHFNTHIKQKGNQLIEYKLDKQIIDLISKIQKCMLNEVKQKKIVIETNPTSNCKIGGFESYEKHPIFVFYNTRIHTSNKKNSVNVSINTDDLGVFNTSLEREYSLIAAAACNQNNDIKTVIKWIDSIRRMSNEQRFEY